MGKPSTQDHFPDGLYMGWDRILGSASAGNLSLCRSLSSEYALGMGRSCQSTKMRAPLIHSLLSDRKGLPGDGGELGGAREYDAVSSLKNLESRSIRDVTEVVAEEVALDVRALALVENKLAISLSESEVEGWPHVESEVLCIEKHERRGKLGLCG
jgi:hypothetical protein